MLLCKLSYLYIISIDVGLSLSHELSSLERSSAVNYCSSRKACFLTRSINHFTMGWFGAGYPNKHHWNVTWWVVCDRLGS